MKYFAHPVTSLWSLNSLWISAFSSSQCIFFSYCVLLLCSRMHLYQASLAPTERERRRGWGSAVVESCILIHVGLFRFLYCFMLIRWAFIISVCAFAFFLYLSYTVDKLNLSILLNLVKRLNNMAKSTFCITLSFAMPVLKIVFPHLGLQDQQETHLLTSCKYYYVNSKYVD